MWKDTFLQNKAFWWLSLTSGMSRKLITRLNYQFLSGSAPISLTFQLPACFTPKESWTWLNNYKQIWHEIKPTHDWIISTLHYLRNL